MTLSKSRFWIAVALAVLGGSMLTASLAFAKVGVGMGAGEIRLDEPVKPGELYELPSVRIFNTGDETTTYEMRITYHQDHPELRPGKEWFSFSPATFTLEPPESQLVSVRMTVPLKSEPGDYFAFIESGPVVSNEPGTSVGVAVATKLYFTVVPANFLQAAAYRASAILAAYTPWSWVMLGVLAFILLIFVLSRFISLNIAVRK